MRVRLGVPAIALFAAAALHAQAARTPVASAAELAIAQGRLDDAESMLFAESARAAHEPSARGALGMFLASRGKLKVGAVLLTEARQFGGDAAVIDGRLARVYAWLGDWAAVSALTHYAASGAEHDRVAWLAAHPPARSGPDSVTVALEPNDVAGLGRIQLSIGGTKMDADINPNIEGLALPSTAEISAQAQQFGMQEGTSAAVIYTVGIGAMKLTNVRAQLSPGARPAIGFDVLTAFSPTFDAAAHVLTLHQRDANSSGDPLPILLSFPGIRIVARSGQAPVAMESAAGRAALRGVRWTFNVKRGAVVAER
jgi:hypothetical protein